MKFSYNEQPEETRECVAEVFHMEGYPEQLCLNFMLTGDSEKVTTLYYDGGVFYQKAFDTSDCSVQKFYKGDTITITF